MEKPTYKPIHVIPPRPDGGRAISLETKRFKLRSLRARDASERYLSWIADAEIMTPLNMPARNLSLEDLKGHIAAFDNRTRYLLGMFDRKTGAHFGVYIVDVSLPQRLARIQYMIGDREFRGIGALRETAIALVGHLFEKRAVEKIAAQVSVDNAPSIAALKAIGFRIEGEMRGEIRSFQDGTRIDQYFFAALHDEWQPPLLPGEVPN